MKNVKIKIENKSKFRFPDLIKRKTFWEISKLFSRTQTAIQNKKRRNLKNDY